MRIAFLGTPDVAVPSLTALAEADDVEIAAVVTNPDRPRGRRGRPQPPPVKVAAHDLGLAVWQPAKPREIVDDLAALDLDAAAVVAYGALLPRDVLATGGRGFVNLHFSLLPRWRGAAPVQHALRAGDTVTGLTCFVLDEGMDTGPVLAQQEVPIEPDEDAGHLLERLATVGAPLLLSALRDLARGVAPTPQATGGVTFAPKIGRDDVRIDWREPAGRIVDLIRSAAPRPGAHTTFRGEGLKVLRARAVPDETGAGPGEVVVADGLRVAAAGGNVLLQRVQPAGKAAMDAAAFVNGYRPEPGERLGAEAPEEER